MLSSFTGAMNLSWLRILIVIIRVYMYILFVLSNIVGDILKYCDIVLQTAWRVVVWLAYYETTSQSATWALTIWLKALQDLMKWFILLFSFVFVFTVK